MGYVMICLIFPVGSPRRYSKIYLAFSQSSTMTSVGQFEWLLLYFIIASFGRNKGGEETNPKNKYITSWSIFIKRCQVAEYISISAFELLLCVNECCTSSWQHQAILNISGIWTVVIAILILSLNNKITCTNIENYHFNNLTTKMLHYVHQHPNSTFPAFQLNTSFWKQ